jgi:hypothetical protein
MPIIDMVDNVEQDRWDYGNKYKELEGGGFSNNDEPKQNRMLENDFCNDRIRNDEVANILLSFNRKNKLDDSCNDEEEKNSEGENKGDKNDQFEANINKSGHELGEGNVCVHVGKITEEILHATNASAEECGVDDCEGELEENSKATFDINNHECNVITDTEDDTGIIFKLKGNDVKVSLRDFGSYVSSARIAIIKDTSAARKHIPHCPVICSTCCRTKVAQIEMYEQIWKIQEKKIEGEQLSILRSTRNEIQERGCLYVTNLSSTTF